MKVHKEKKYVVNTHEAQRWGIVKFVNGKLSFINLHFNEYGDVQKNLELLKEIVKLAEEKSDA